jgi:hypothetical protein
LRYTFLIGFVEDAVERLADESWERNVPAVCPYMLPTSGIRRQ